MINYLFINYTLFQCITCIRCVDIFIKILIQWWTDISSKVYSQIYQIHHDINQNTVLTEDLYSFNIHGIWQTLLSRETYRSVFNTFFLNKYVLIVVHKATDSFERVTWRKTHRQHGFFKISTSGRCRSLRCLKADIDLAVEIPRRRSSSLMFTFQVEWIKI